MWRTLEIQLIRLSYVGRQLYYSSWSTLIVTLRKSTRMRERERKVKIRRQNAIKISRERSKISTLKITIWPRSSRKKSISLSHSLAQSRDESHQLLASNCVCAKKKKRSRRQVAPTLLVINFWISRVGRIKFQLPKNIFAESKRLRGARQSWKKKISKPVRNSPSSSAHREPEIYIAKKHSGPLCLFVVSRFFFVSRVQRLFSITFYFHVQSLVCGWSGKSR